MRTAEAPSLLYKVPSIVKVLNLAEMFSTAQPLEVELGSGDGSFLVEYAARRAEHNFIGVERLLGRIRKIELGRRSRNRGLIDRKVPNRVPIGPL